MESDKKWMELKNFSKKDKIDDDAIFRGEPFMRHYCHRGCAYTVLQTVQKYGVCSVVLGTVHY